MAWGWQPDLPLLEEITIGFDCLCAFSHVELTSEAGMHKWWIDIPNLTSCYCCNSFSFLTELVSENADSLATAFRDASPFCGYEQSLPFTALNDQPSMIESLTIASGVGNTVELEKVNLSSLTNLHLLHIEERCFLFTKQFIVHDLQLLKSIRIERYCCVIRVDPVWDSLLSIKSCSLLESIRIGGGCFYSYSSMELESGCEWDEWRNRPTFSFILLRWGRSQHSCFLSVYKAHNE